MNRIVFCDFNGTITDRDMLGTLAAPSRHDENSAGTVDSGSSESVTLRAEISSLAASITLSREEAERVLEERLRFDDSFRTFARSCRAAGVELVVLTSGVAELIERYLTRRGIIGLPVIGNEAEYSQTGWRIHFRDRSPDGNAKFPYVMDARRRHCETIVIGDDESDFEAAVVADRRFAKRNSPLDRFLSANALAHVPFDSFDEIAPEITRL